MISFKVFLEKVSNRDYLKFTGSSKKRKLKKEMTREIERFKSMPHDDPAAYPDDWTADRKYKAELKRKGKTLPQSEYTEKFKKMYEGVELSSDVYHVTHKDNVENILKNGLVGGQEKGFTIGGFWADKVYEKRPVYVSLTKGKYKEKDTTELKIDTAGLEFFPDLPGLIDLGAAISDDQSIYWESDSDIPEPLLQYCEDGEIFFYELMHDDDVIHAAIESTGTAVVLGKIPASKILTDINEENEMLGESNVNIALKNKSEKTGIPVRFLRRVYNKGLAAWRTGHRPGVAQHQWAMGRVNSFIVGGPARESDAEIWNEYQEFKKSA